MHQDPFARFKSRIVEQHVVHGGIGDSDAGGVAQIDRVGQLGGEARGVIGECLREAIDVEAAHACDVLAQVLATVRAGGACATHQRGVRHHAIAGRERRDAVADRNHLARRLGADREGELAFGEGHAAEAPYVDMVQPDVADAKLDLTRSGRGRARAPGQRELAIGQQLQRADWRHVGRGHPYGSPITRHTFCPPNPNELEIACCTCASRAMLGTQSTGSVGSGVS